MNLLTLPEPIFRDIIVMVGLESPESLLRAMKVCSQWNEKIMRDIWESPSRKKIMKERFERSWGPDMLPTDEEISHAKWLEARAILDTATIKRLTERLSYDLGVPDIMKVKCAASLAHHGLLTSVYTLVLRNDLSPVPAQQLASLVSCVTRCLSITNVSGRDLVILLSSLKCEQLDIHSQSLGREETQALVQAMESGVKVVRLSGEVTLDMETLAEYSGQGACRSVWVWRSIADKYWEDLRTWARGRNWRIELKSKTQIVLRG